MHSTTQDHGTSWKALLLSLAFGLLLAGPSIAADSSGEGRLEAKNSDAMTLVVNEVVIEVTDDTRIYGSDKKRIAFKQIPEPTPVPITVKYEGSMTATSLIATKLVVAVTPH